MYGFDVSKMISVAKGDISQTSWTIFFEIIHMAECGPFYTVDLWVKYRTDSTPAPSVSDHIVSIKEGQRLDCNAMLHGAYWLDHPVKCTITDSLGNEVFTKTKWLKAGIGQDTDFFRGVSLPSGVYDVFWSVCGKQEDHKLVVVPFEYTENDIDVNMVVDDNTDIDETALWNAVKDEIIANYLLDGCTIELKYIETKGKELVIFHLHIQAPIDVGVGVIPVLPIIVLAIIVAIGVAWAYVEHEKTIRAEFSYNISMKQFLTPDGKYLYHNDYIGYMATYYPDEWAVIKDYIVKPKDDEEPDWMTYIMYIVMAVGAMAGIFILVKYVLPALKGRG